MRSCPVLFMVCVILSGGAYVSTSSITENRVIGTNFTLNVITVNHNVIMCHLVNPANETLDFNPSLEGKVINEKYVQEEGNLMSQCRITVLNLNESDNGVWKLFYERDGDDEGRSQLYDITVHEATAEIATIEPSEQYFDTNIGASHKIIIAKADFVNSKSCHLHTPDGKEYTITKDLDIPNVDVIEGSEVECGVNIQVTAENIGEWMLIAKVTRYSRPIEKQILFTIYVEENVDASPAVVTVSEGNNLFIRLRQSTDEYESCEIVAPFGNERSFNVVPKHDSNCGFTIETIDTTGSGIWKIVYGNKIVYKANINVTVVERITVNEERLLWVRDRPINVTIGPEEAIYCIVKDPLGFSVYDGFGRCKIVLEKVTDEHFGSWKMLIGTPGRVLLVESQFYVLRTEAESKALVSTQVTKDAPSVSISCSVNSPHEVHGCKFRNPQGEILLASEGVGEDQYIFHGVGVRYESGVHSHECGIRIINLTVKDLGLWRCAINTEGENYYGFLTVLCPWAMQDAEVAASVISEPTLTVVASSVTREEGESVTMSCSIQSDIRYCYFRAQNGSVFSVSPATISEDFEYVGAGFDAGECGIRFKNLLVSDSGSWSCHVGLPDTPQEQRAQIQVTVEDPISVKIYWDHYNQLIVEGVVNRQRPLDYCRFVRMDGLGFTTENIPYGYIVNHPISYGNCVLTIPTPSMLDRHPWTISVKVHGHESEITRSTDHALHGLSVGGYTVNFYLSVSIIFICLLILTIGVVIGPKKNREWTRTRYSELRRSFRNSIAKKPLPEQKV